MSNKPTISLIGPAHRTKDWLDFYSSIHTNLEFEVIFAGENKPDFKLPDNFHYIYTKVKPAQLYEITFNEAKGELIHWTADDATYSPYSFDYAYNLYKKNNDYKKMISFKVIEAAHDKNLYDMTEIHFLFYGENPPIKNSLRMMPFGLASRKIIDEVGGWDINFISGQGENDLVLRIYEAGGSMEVCKDAIVYNLEWKHGNEDNFKIDHEYHTKLLKDLWVEEDTIVLKRKRPVERFKLEDILTKNQGIEGKKWKL